MSKKLAENLSKTRIYLVSDNKLDRMSWKRVLNELGSSPDKIEFFETFPKAISAIEQTAPGILMCTYEIKEELADDCLATFRKHAKGVEEDLCILVGDEGGPSFTLSAMEYEADIQLIKPYTAADIESQVKVTLEKKYSLAIEDKQKLKAIGKFRMEQEPEGIDINALQNHEPSSLLSKTFKAEVLYSQGQKNEAFELYEEVADEDFSYQTLVRLFDIFVKESMPEKAFDVADMILLSYPLHHSRISNYFKVCILTSNYHSFVDYAKSVEEAGVNNPELTLQLAAGLAVCGKSIGITDPPVALDASVTAIRMGKAKIQIVDRGLRTLLELKEFALVKELIVELSEYEELSDTLAIAEYRTLESEGDEPFMVLQRGIDLTNKGLHDFHVYEMILKSAKKAGRKKEFVLELAENASKHYPEKSQYFKSLIA